MTSLPTEEQLNQYFEENQEKYKVPEQRRIAYAKFYPKSYIKDVTSVATRVEYFFNQHRQEFEIPEKVVIQHVLYSANDFTDQASATEEEIQQQFGENSAKYMKPEQIKVRFIAEPLVALANTQNVTQEAIESYYEKNLFRYEHKEQAKARHILLRVTDGLTAEETEAIKNRALEIRTEIEQGLPFSEAAEKYSADTGSAIKGGDLGYFGRGQMVPPFEKAAFELPLGQISDPIKTQYGYHLIRVEDRQEEGTDPLEDVADEIRQTLQKQLAVNQFRALGNSVESLTDLQDQYAVQTTDFFERNVKELPGIPTKDLQTFSRMAFMKTPDKTIQIAGNIMMENLYLIESIDRLETRPLTLEEARETVIEDVKEKNAKELALQAAEEDAAMVKGATGATLEQVASARGLKVTTLDPFGREDRYIPELGSDPTEIINTAFTLTEDEIAGPIETRKGQNIIRLVSRDPARLPELVEVQPLVERAYVKDQSERMARNQANLFADELFSKKAALEVEAASQGIEWGTTELFRAGGAIPGLGMKRELNQEAFKLEAIGSVSTREVESRMQGYGRDPSTMPIDAYYIAQLLEIKEPYLPDLAEAREDVERDLKLKLAEAYAERYANEALQAIQSALAANGPIDATRSVDLSLYEDTGSDKQPLGGKGASYKGPYDISGNGQVQGIGMAYPVAKTALAMKPGQISNPIKNYRMRMNEDKERIQDAMTGVYIIQVLEKIEPDAESKSQFSMQKYFERSAQSLAFNAWIEEVSAASKIEYNQEYFHPEEDEENMQEEETAASE